MNDIINGEGFRTPPLHIAARLNLPKAIKVFILNFQCNNAALDGYGHIHFKMFLVGPKLGPFFSSDVRLGCDSANILTLVHSVTFANFYLI